MDDAPERFMRVAVNVATVALDRGELPIGAAVVLDGRILATAHTAEVAEGRTLVHAELLALEAADRIRPFPGRRTDVQLYTTVEPCLMCLGAAMTFGLGAIYYALESPGDGAAHLAAGWQRAPLDLPSYRVPALHAGLLRDDVLALFRRYLERHQPGPLRDWAARMAAL